MAERIVSPGVFTREKDLSFLPQGIAEIGAAIVGPTKKGPAFVPTVVRNFSEFTEMFGGLDPDLYVPFTVREYLRSAGTVTIVRVLGIGGYSSGLLELKAHKSGTTNFETLAVLAPNASEPNATFASATVAGTLSALNVKTGSFAHSASLDPTSDKYVEKVFSKNPLATKANGVDTPFYLYKVFKSALTAHGSGSALAGGDISTISLAQDYQSANTPFITSQPFELDLFSSALI